jgi:hypothetical protein
LRLYFYIYSIHYLAILQATSFRFLPTDSTMNLYAKTERFDYPHAQN